MLKLMKRILKSTNLKDKIRIFMMLTICVSFLFFSIATTYIYKGLFHENTSRLMRKNFTLTYNNLEKIVNNAKIACSIIENEESVYTILTNERDFTDEEGNALYNGYQTYLNMQKAIVFSTDTYDIDGITIYSNSGCIYGDTGKTYFDLNQIQKSRWYKQLEANRDVSMFCNSDYFSDAEQVSKGNLYYIKLIRSHSSGKYIGAIRITVSSERIENILSPDLADFGNTTFLQNDIGEVVTDLNNTEPIKIDIEETTEQVLNYNDDTAIITQSITGTNLFLISATSYKDAMSDFNKIKLIIYIITAVIILSSYKLSKVFSNGITKRLNAMMNSMDNVRHGVFQPVPQSDNFDDIEACINNYNDMLSEFQMLLNTQKEHEAQKRNLQFKVLQEQIKPHFLYNTLELINNAAIINNIPEISEIVLELSSFYRLSLSQGEEIHTLEEELRHISLYFSLQNKRTQKPLTLTINAPQELMNIKIPKLLLQPIMENAYYHGFPVPITKENARIEVTIKKVEDDIIIEFYDNGTGIPYDIQENILTTESRSGFGLKNINERIKLGFGDAYGLSITSVPDVETIVVIKLPYSTNS